MQVELNFRSKVPIYIQIIDQIKHLIASGMLRPDDQLPTVRQLAADLRVNFNTVARAYRLLDEQGLISTQHGRGTYILQPPTAENGERLRRQDLDWLTTQYLSDAALLDYSPEQVQIIFDQFLNKWKQEGKPPQQDHQQRQG
jgi:GntR family transcriptional regulator